MLLQGIEQLSLNLGKDNLSKSTVALYEEVNALVIEMTVNAPEFVTTNFMV
jgi:hypothetical protein